MPQLQSYGIDGPDQRPDAYETVADIPFNRVLFAGKFTDTPPTKPQIVYGLTGLSQVFEQYAPGVAVRFQSEKGVLHKEQFSFTAIEDFSYRKIQQQSPFISGLEKKKVQWQKMIRELRKNQALKELVSRAGTKKRILERLQLLLKKVKG